MKHITLSALLLLAGVSTRAQVVFESGAEAWTDGLPDDFMGSKTNIATANVLQVTETPHGGTSCVQLVNASTASNQHKRFTTQPMSVVLGQPYDISLWVRGRGQVRFGIFDERPGNGYSNYSDFITIAGGEQWEQLTYSITAAANSDIAEFIFSVLATEAPEHLQIDDVTISLGEIVPPVEVSIYDIQFTTDETGASPLVNTAVITSGIVTASDPGQGYFLQDGAGAWNGIYVNDPANAPALGDEVQVSATVEENFSLTRLSLLLDYAVLSSGNTVPTPEALLPVDAAQEQWECVLVTVSDLECIELPTAENFQQWIGANWQGSMIVDDLLFATTPELGSIYSVTGIMYYSFSEWKVEPRDANDLGVGSGLAEFHGASVNVFPNPASDALTIDLGGLDGRTEYNVFDATGRAVIADVISFERSTMDVSSLTNGVYLLTLRNGSDAWSTRIAVQH